MTKRLYRGNDRILGGVCSGIAEYCAPGIRLPHHLHLLLGCAVLYRGMDCDAGKESVRE